MLTAARSSAAAPDSFDPARRWVRIVTSCPFADATGVTLLHQLAAPLGTALMATRAHVAALKSGMIVGTESRQTSIDAAARRALASSHRAERRNLAARAAFRSSDPSARAFAPGSLPDWSWSSSDTVGIPV
ncbi:MAG: hypothetical protein OES32_01035 [Acidobacteriota bacterium]|nr:hypothetical protein [Acidobacteriota bacterium]MDH3522145.1 hypothetical protein [Acidobacteriota bacterium]